MQTTSTPYDVDPSTSTFSFRHASYSSSLVSFDPVERYGNDYSGDGTRAVRAQLSPLQQGVYRTYDPLAVVGGLPFLDIGNSLIATQHAFDPAILKGLTWQQIASKLSNPKDPVARAIVGAANYLIAGLCTITNGQPAPVCGLPVVAMADRAMAIG